MHDLPSLETMHRAVDNRDKTFEGVFVVAIVTTNIFCRPGCPARAALPQNRRFFSTAAEALFAGFRACKRCKPLDRPGLPSWATSLIEELDVRPDQRITAAGLRQRGIEPARARRVFQQHFGMSFHAYGRARRLSTALTQIRNGAPVDDVVFGSGFSSHSGFRDAFSKTFGRTPARSRDYGCVTTLLYHSPLGSIILGAVDDGLCLLEFTDRRMLPYQMTVLGRYFGARIVPGNHAHLDQTREELEQYFRGERREFSVPIVAPGTPFQQRVWDAVRAIGYGHTKSYQEIAVVVESPDAERAVGRANGFNRIGIIIPCHRVVTKDGKLGGYGGGLWRKQRLLDLERAGTISAQSVLPLTMSHAV
jgi:AraC family transcriptional regulator, regulatory protein of adaptative response / methylated-DNA-[protein]-cysteine methyltransferase